MANEQIHEGVWVRQVLKRKKKVRITFVPLNPTRPTATSVRDYDEGEKIVWTQFFGNINPPIDIDTGITLLRFNNDQTSGIASFHPNSSSQPDINHPFQPADAADPGDGAGRPEFNACIEGKRSTQGDQFFFPAAVAECLSQLDVG